MVEVFSAKIAGFKGEPESFGTQIALDLLASALAKLTKAYEERAIDAYLSSHPPTAERIEYLRGFSEYE